MKNKTKYHVFRKSQDIVKETTDITKVIRVVSEIESLKTAMLTPAQQRLLKFVALGEAEIKHQTVGKRIGIIRNDVDENTTEEPRLTISEAYAEVKNSSKSSNELTARISNYILQNMPKTLLTKENSSNLMSPISEAEISLKPNAKSVWIV